MPKIAVIGSGFSGLSAATYLAKEGHEVHVFEKNSQAGGRARLLKTENGYSFDMGPSWYWMPDVYEKYFADFGASVSDYYSLKLLDPSFDVVYENGLKYSIPENFKKLCALFESIEAGSSDALIRFMKEAEYKYNIGINKLVHKPGLSFMEFLDLDVITGSLRLQVFSSFSKHVRSYFKNPKLISLMEFPVLFLGAMPQDTPALYSLMNYAGLKLGTWYPMGGFASVVSGMESLAKKWGVTFHFDSPIERIETIDGLVSGVRLPNTTLSFDGVIASADYNHVEEKLLGSESRNYSPAYWNKKVFAPSCLIYYLGVSKRIDGLAHHTLFFDEDLFQHSVEIYKKPEWPTKPLFYVCCPSKTDSKVAPDGHENLFLLMPLAPGLSDNEATREKYFRLMMDRLEKQTGTDIRNNLDYKQSYCVSDFMADYNSYKGNAYGLANTLMQTAIWKPKINNKKHANLFYTGQLTVPGPGVPPAIISGKLAANLLTNYFIKNNHEITV